MKIKIVDVSLDVGNFRHDAVTTERAAILTMLRDEKQHKVSELAQDIVEQRGLDPSSLLIVTEDAAGSGHYIALEGNRRITALKTLISPELADGLPSHGLFRKLHPQFLALGIEDVDCVVLSRSQASVWVKRKHYKGMGGKGVLKWNAMATARSDRADGNFTRWMTALAYIEEHGIDAEDLRDRISSKTTTIERLLTSADIQGVLGVSFDRSGKLTAENGNEAAAVNLLHAMLNRMGDPDFSETQISSKTQQQKFIADFKHLSVKLPTHPTGPNGAGSGTSSSSGGSSASGAGGGSGSSSASSSASKSATATAAGKKTSRPVRDRTKLAEKGLRISNNALNRLYSELRKLDAEKSPFTASVMNRVFLEKSTAIFLDDMAIACPNPKGWQDFSVKLKDKVAAVLSVVDPGGSTPKLVYAREIANAVKDKLHTLDHLNTAIHDHNYAFPSYIEIIKIWDRLHPYYEKIFETLENNGK